MPFCEVLFTLRLREANWLSLHFLAKISDATIGLPMLCLHICGVVTTRGAPQKVPCFNEITVACMAFALFEHSIKKLYLPCNNFVLSRGNQRTPESYCYQSSLRCLHSPQLTGATSSPLAHIVLPVPLQCLIDHLSTTTLCRMQPTIFAIILLLWQHNIPAVLPTATGQILRPFRFKHTHLLSILGIRDTQQALREQSNMRLTTTHAARLQICTTKAQHPRATRAMGKLNQLHFHIICSV
jgi:hypothetical protein